MGDVELAEKLGRRDLCPCGSRRLFRACCLPSGRFDGSLRAHYVRDE
jgi:hypothetical protein